MKMYIMDQKCPSTSEIQAFLSPPSPQKRFSTFLSRRGGTLSLPPITLHASQRQRRMFVSLLSKTASALLLKEFQMTTSFHTE